jgi:hypothetical protein
MEWRMFIDGTFRRWGRPNNCSGTDVHESLKLWSICPHRIEQILGSIPVSLSKLRFILGGSKTSYVNDDVYVLNGCSK